MTLEEPRCRTSRLLTVHGPHGVDVAAVLEHSGIRLTADDLLIIVEHDDPVAPWLERENAPLLAAA